MILDADEGKTQGGKTSDCDELGMVKGPDCGEVLVLAMDESLSAT